MVWQDGTAVDVRGDPDPGRVATEHSGAYLAAGLALALYGAALAAWVVYGILERDSGVGEFLEGIFNPRAAAPAAQLLGPYEWALATALLVVGGLALSQRRVARGAALLLGFILLAMSLREAIGLLNASYRKDYSLEYLGGWALATRGLGLLVAVVVLTALLPAAQDAGPGADRWWQRRLSRVCAVLFLVMGVVQGAWLIRDLTAAGVDASRYLHGAVDASVLGQIEVATTDDFYTVASAVALLVLGVLAYRGGRDLRSALVLFAAVQLYVTVRTVVWLTVTGFFGAALSTTEGTLLLVTTAYALAATTCVVMLATGRAFTPYAGGSRQSWLRARPD